MSRATRGAIALAVATVLSACARGDADDPTVVRTDSAGVRIVASGAPDRPLTWRFEPVAAMTDSAGAPFLFDALPAEYVLTDRGSRTYVLTRDQSIVRFGPDGRHDRTLGRKGSGPGEMQLPVQLGAQGDSLVVVDPVRNAIVRWGPDLGAIRELPMEGALAEARRLAFRTGGLWVERHEFTPPAGEVTVSLLGDTLGSAPLYRVVQPRSTTVRLCNGMIALPPFFSPKLTWVATGPRILVNASADYVLWLHEGTRAIASVRRSLPSRAPTVADAERLMPNGLRVVFGGQDECSMPVAEVVAITGLAPVMPQVDGLRLLSDGSMWVIRPATAADSLPVDVINPDGTYAGTMSGRLAPLSRFPNGDLLMPVADTMSGGFNLVRMKVTTGNP
jgi:hypothetical protein